MNKWDIVCFGALIMDMFPVETGKRLIEVSAFKPTAGGAPANVAVAASRLGAKTAFIGKVGDDSFGHYLHDVIKKEGVETKGMRFDRYVRTTMNFHAKPNKDTIEHLFYRNPGADITLRCEELDRELLSNTRVFHFDSLCLTDEPVKSATYEAVEISRLSGAVISFDVNYRSAVWENPEDAIKSVLEILENVDILKLNEDELKLLCGSGDIETSAASLLKKGPKLCVVTLGSKGSYFSTAKGSGFVQSIDIAAIDTIGCGDAFIAGLLTKITANGKDPEELSLDQLNEYMCYADTVAALTATRYGTIPAMPFATEVDKLLKKRISV